MCTPSAAAKPRNFEDKLFRIGLESLIDELQSFRVSSRRVGATRNHNNKNNEKHKAESSLPSPPPTPHRHTKQLPAPLLEVNRMDRGSLHGAPRRDAGAPIFSTQDARNATNLAVQPTAATVKVNLKKAAVKIKGPAATSASASVMAASAPVTTPVAPLKVSTPAEQSDALNTLMARLVAKMDSPKQEATESPQQQPIKSPKNKVLVDAEAGLDEMFERLTTTPSAPRSSATAGPEKNAFVFETEVAGSPKVKEAIVKKEPVIKQEPVVKHKCIAEKEPIAKKEPVDQDQVAKKQVLGNQDSSRPRSSTTTSTSAAERAYLQKALDYLLSLPIEGTATSAGFVKAAAAELQGIYDSSPPTAKETLKEEYAVALATFIRNVSDNKPGDVKPSPVVEHLLKEENDNLLRLCARMADDEILSLQSLDEMISLCQVILDVVSERKKNVPEETPEKAENNIPTASVSAWPAQEKRETVAGCRTIVLKGVSHLTSINQLQSLVWGGRIESLSLPHAKDYAMIKFMTPEGCDKYFSATENGIEIPGDKTKKVYFVERQPGPNSVNDLLQNSADGDVTRCVRATDADKDWSDMLLLRIARGRDKVKRDIDRIIRKHNAQDRYYIEFRFASIYNALNFKRELSNDDEWEQCHITYAPDPCETAQGVHIKDD